MSRTVLLINLIQVKYKMIKCILLRIKAHNIINVNKKNKIRYEN